MESRKIQIAPSMMCADPFQLSETMKVFEQGGIEWLHIDVMDGHYVPNFTLGPDYCRFLRRVTDIPLDFHLMVENADRQAELFAEFTGARLSFHPEAVRQPLRLIQRLRELGLSPAIAIDPAMPLESCKHLIPLVDQVVIMTVNPGYAGQKLIPFTLDKIAACREILDELDHKAAIEVDGNVSWENIPKMVAAGADVLVAGTSSLFQEGRVTAEAVERMRG